MCLCVHMHAQACSHMHAYECMRGMVHVEDNGDVGPHLLPSLRQDLFMLAFVSTKLHGL